MQERHLLSLPVNGPNIGSLNDANGTEKDINMAYLAVNYLVGKWSANKDRRHMK